MKGHKCIHSGHLYCLSVLGPWSPMIQISDQIRYTVENACQCRWSGEAVRSPQESHFMLGNNEEIICEESKSNRCYCTDTSLIATSSTTDQMAGNYIAQMMILS